MAFPNSSPVAGGDTAAATQYNNLRNDALYPILQDFTYGETIAVNASLYLKASDQKVYKTDADFDDERIHSWIGFANEAGVLNDVKKVQTGGKVAGLSGLTAGSRYYLSGTAGAISITPGAYKKHVGIALSTTELFIEKYPEFVDYGAPTRVANTIYQNGNKWRMVMMLCSVTGQAAGGYSGSVTAYIGSSSPPTTNVGGMSCSVGMASVSGTVTVGGEVTFWVPPLWYYKADVSAQGAAMSMREIDLNW